MTASVRSEFSACKVGDEKLAFGGLRHENPYFTKYFTKQNKEPKSFIYTSFSSSV